MRELSPFWKRLVAILGVFWVGFLTYTAITQPLNPLLQGPIALCFALTITFLLFPFSKNRLSQDETSVSSKILFGTKNSPSLADILMIIGSIVPVIIIIVQRDKIAYNLFSAGTIETYHLVLGIILVLLLLEISRRTVGLVITAVVGFFIAYTFLGQFIPGRFGHSGFSLREIIYQVYLMKEGMTGTLLDIGSRVIPMFIFFGAVLFATGAGETLMRIAMIAAGRIRGGAGQVAVVSSALFGSISGSAVANVTATGSFTIPTMKKVGFSNDQAGGIEAAASTGGQLLPPIMGAGAFLMAEFLGLPYVQIMAAAFLPAILYFFGVGIGLYFASRRRGLGKLPPEMVPNLRQVFRIRDSLCLFIPVGILLYFLIERWPAQMAAGWALIAVLVLYIFIGGNLSLDSLKGRIKRLGGGFWVGISSLAMLLALVVAIQIAVTLISFTGIGVKFSSLLVGLGEGAVLPTLLLTAVVAIILGMGMPTTAAYLIAVAVAGPPLISLGFPPLASHLFVFYFAIMSGLTPPVAVTVITANVISGGNWLRSAWIACRLAVAGFVIPFFFIYKPALLLDGSPLEILLVAVTALAGVAFIAAGMFGILIKPATVLERVLFVFGGLLLAYPEVYSSVAGLVMLALGILSQQFMPRIAIIGTRPSAPDQGHAPESKTG